jgi:ribosomal protein S4
MGEPIKITEEEFNEFNKLKEEIQRNIFEFGELYLEKMELDVLYKNLSDKENSLRNKTEEFKKREGDLMDKILQKYGEGGLNLKSGMFTPN